ncbi:MAG TPA: phosphate ABC transporter ATP-binding protein [Anaerolineales bacterium]|nr:phosphate ABC transporter ATP-binding protein [Anaerolineales bacterium]
MTDSACYRLEGIEYSYGGRWRLEIPLLEVMAGEILALIGPTGAGKSTLLRLLHFLEPPSTGRMAFEGREIGYPPPLELRRRVGMIFQRPLMLAGTVRHNIAIGLRFRGESEGGRVEELLRRFDLEALADREARLISGGEMQRVALARALAYEPAVLLLDEPAANLDPGHVRAIERIIREAHELAGLTMVVATHNLAQARRLSQRTAMLSAGRLIEAQPTERLFANPMSQVTADYVYEETLLERPESP